MAWPEPEQLAFKARRVAERLRHDVTAAHPSPRALAWRARIRLRRTASGGLGYAEARSHALVEVGACAIAREPLQQALAGLGEVPGAVDDVELRQSEDGTVALAVRATRGQQRAAGAWQAPGVRGVAVDGRTVAGDPRVTWTVAGVRQELGPTTFFQVNPEVNALLVERVGLAVRSFGPERLLELYAGAGNLSLPLARSGVVVEAWEGVAAAAQDGRRNAAANGLAVDFKQRDADRYRAGDAVFDVALLDPPRAGGGRVLAELVTTRPRGVVLVSCNPDDVARVLPDVLRAGYAVTALEVLDMFPQTNHVEVLVVLARR